MARTPTVKVLSEGKYHRIVEGVDSTGQLYRAFECQIDPDDPERLAYLFGYDEYDNYLEELARQAAHRVQMKRLDRFDRREFRPHTVQLGRRVNQIPFTNPGAAGR